MGNNCADLAIPQIKLLLTVNAIALSINLGTMRVTATHAGCLDAVVETVEVARHAVEVVGVP